MRLDKFLVETGWGPRSSAKELIKNSQVKVNKRIIKDGGYRVNEEQDEIFVNDHLLKYRKFIYVMLNKPAGYVSAVKDKLHPTVTELVKEYDYCKLFPVGRLDIDTEGLLLLTNDGDFSHKITSPKNAIPKVYYAEYKGEYLVEYKEKFREGLILKDGYQCLSADIENLGNQRALVTIYEGKYHQVKKMFEVLNLKVTFLKRISIGKLALDENLKVGEYRLLTEEEHKAIS